MALVRLAWKNLAESRRPPPAGARRRSRAAGH